MFFLDELTYALYYDPKLNAAIINLLNYRIRLLAWRFRADAWRQRM